MTNTKASFRIFSDPKKGLFSLDVVINKRYIDGSISVQSSAREVSRVL